MHAKRLLTESGTRDALHGPFWAEYLNSVTALRGWDDSDGFYTSYTGHPMEGSVFAFIQKQNDPRYRGLRFNEGRNYWISQLRAMAFAALWSTQWTLGLASEASIGNAPLYNSPGFVDLVGTPTFGIGWSIGEDFIDRYLIERLEQHTANRTLLMLVRGFGNPTRSFANLMGARIPWQRETRPGLFKQNFLARSENIRSRKEHAVSDSLVYSPSDRSPLLAVPAKPASAYPKVAPIELEATGHYETFLGGGSCIGGGGSGSLRLSPSWQFVAEISGCLVIKMPTNESGDSLLYVAGTRWTPRATHTVSPYLQLLVGGRKVTHDLIDPKLRAELQNAWDAGQLSHYPKRSESSVENTANGFALLAGGGMDINVHPALTIRMAKLEYTRSFLPPVDRIDAEHGIRFTSGLVLRIGTW